MPFGPLYIFELSPPCDIFNDGPIKYPGPKGARGEFILNSKKPFGIKKNEQSPKNGNRGRPDGK